MSQTDHPTPLAADFAGATLEQWRALVDKALKGGDFEKRLVNQTADGMRLPPLYTRADARPEAAAPGAAPYTRGTRAVPAGFGWDIVGFIDSGDAASANRAILAELEGGANGILLQVAAPGQTGVAIASPQDAAAALAGVYLDLASVHLAAGLAGGATTRHVLAALPALGGTAGRRRLAFGVDPIASLARFGTAGGPIAAALDEATKLAAVVRTAEPGASTIRADAALYHEAGASEAQELAAMAATLTAYLRAFEAAHVAPSKALPQIVVRLAADTDIFLTAAKLRAARTVIARIATACGAGAAAADVAVTTVTSGRMMARRDPWTNMVRTTAATAAAAFGGADSLVVLPFSHALGSADAFARRIARNTQIVAQEESHLGRVVDPAGGSWYVERATAELAATAWALFQEIEAAGGIVAALTAGMIQDLIAAVAADRAKAIATGKLELTGVSAFPRLGSDGVTVTPRPDPAPVPGVLAVRPLEPRRLAEPFEALRDAADAAATPPRIFLASLGTVGDHNARSNWVLNFLASGGIAAASSDGYATPDEAIAAFEESAAKVAVIASSDEVYGRLAEATARSLKTAGANHVVMAGRPGAGEATYRAAGVDRFVFAGQDILATLAELQAEIGR